MQGALSPAECSDQGLAHHKCWGSELSLTASEAMTLHPQSKRGAFLARTQLCSRLKGDGSRVFHPLNRQGAGREYEKVVH